MLHCPVTKQFCLAFCTVKCSLVSDWVIRTNSKFFINELLNFVAVLSLQVFHLFMQDFAENVAFSVPSAKYSPFTYLGKKLEYQLNPNLHCSTQCRAGFLYTKMLVLWDCTFLRTK